MSSEMLNAVILPDETVNKEAIKLSQKFIKKFDTYFVLDGNRFYPHITLYQTGFPHKNYGIVVEAIRQIASEAKSFEVAMNGFSLSATTFISWNCVITKELRTLHEKIIVALNPLRGPPPSFYKGLGFTELQIKSIENYGYPAAINLYSPHITITRIKDENQAESVKRELRQHKMSFEIDAIYLGRLGDHGTVTEILEEFPFKAL